MLLYEVGKATGQERPVAWAAILLPRKEAYAGQLTREKVVVRG